MVSSYNTEMLNAVDRANEGKRDIITQSLRNYDLQHCANDYAYEEPMNGVNVAYDLLNPALVQRVRVSEDTLVGVWFTTTTYTENA